MVAQIAVKQVTETNHSPAYKGREGGMGGWGQCELRQAKQCFRGRDLEVTSQNLFGVAERFPGFGRRLSAEEIAAVCAKGFQARSSIRIYFC